MVFSLIYNVCVFLQKGPPGPPQPQRQRPPAAMMPREVEAHPKLNHGLKSEGGVLLKAEMWKKERVPVGCPRGERLHSLLARLQLLQPRRSSSPWDQTLTRRAALSSFDHFLILIRQERTEL